jgi:hypothetical protein
VTKNGELVAKVGGERHLGVCYGVDTSGTNGVRSGTNGFRYCPDNFGVGPLVTTRRLGDTAEENFIRYERVVIYVPKLNYLGPDYFTYLIKDGSNLQLHTIENNAIGSENQVTIHVRNCRRVKAALYRQEYKLTQPICVCKSSETALIADERNCHIAIQSICNQETSRSQFLSLCLACTLNLPQDLQSQECLDQTIRAVSFMYSLSLCTKEPTVDCSSERITLPGHESVNYLSLAPPMLEDSFTALGNGIGGIGWYKSPPDN